MVVRIGMLIGAEVEAISLPLIYTGIAGISINLVLAMINLLPIPPLDGSRVLSGFLPSYWAWQYNRLEQYGFIILLILLYTRVLNFFLEYPMYIAQKLFFSIAGL
jgi:Zn-dependent protease